VALELLGLAGRMGLRSWRGAQLNGKPFRLMSTGTKQVRGMHVPNTHSHTGMHPGMRCMLGLGWVAVQMGRVTAGPCGSLPDAVRPVSKCLSRSHAARALRRVFGTARVAQIPLRGRLHVEFSSCTPLVREDGPLSDDEVRKGRW
jgi:hypothetical protein